ncbi:MAG: PilZ domain-containing protein [Desulfarculaceae bacterium]|nr:PilZ domain-containing protein [Desulfarculaceae bacterium]
MAEDFKNRSEKDPEKNAEESLELEPLEEDPDSDRHLRKSYRLHVKDRDDCTVAIENNTYPLKDFSLTGLGVSIETEVVFQLGEFLGDSISGVRLDLVDQTMEDLEYKIVHISPDTDNQMVCGMVWLNPTPEKEEKLYDILKSLKNGSLKPVDPDEDEEPMI